MRQSGHGRRESAITRRRLCRVSPTAFPAAARADFVSILPRAEACARYPAPQQQLLQQLGAGAGAPFAPLPLAHALRLTQPASDSSSAESVSSHNSPGASPPLVLAARTAPLRCTRVRTLYACLGESEGELSFEPNQIITNVSPSPEPGWLRGTLNGRTGLVPENYVEPLP